MSALTLRNLTKTYANGVEALKGIDLTVERGDFFALLGPNGAGKSTTIGIVSSLVNKTGGEVTILGHSLDQERELAKQKIGVVPQEFNFSQFEKVFDIVVTQAGFYGIPAPLARQRRREVPAQAGAVGQAQEPGPLPVRGHEAPADDRPRPGPRAGAADSG